MYVMRFRQPLLLAWFSVLTACLSTARGQQEVGYLERFALAEDRREALEPLIPGTNEYFYFRCLHAQNQKDLAQSEAILDDWRAKLGQSDQLDQMFARQILLTYNENPRRTLDYLEQQLQLQLNHARPARNQSKQFPTVLDNSQLSIQKLLENSLAADRSYGQLEDSGLRWVVDQRMEPQQLRAVLSRLQRADLPGVTERIIEELRLKDSPGFGWAAVHGLLTREQLDQLTADLPALLEDGKFIRAYAARLAPREGLNTDAPQVRRAYLNELRKWTGQLTASQNSLKALVIGNLLRLDLSERRFDRELFKEYLALPRVASYYRDYALRIPGGAMASLDYQLQPEIPLPPMGDDSALIRRYLEQFLAADETVSDFATWLDRNFLERIQAEAKILMGIGDKRVWYQKLGPSAQKELSERVELRFAPHNNTRVGVEENVRLDVELKNVDELIVRIYEVNTSAYYRNHSQPVDTDINLDGWVANSEQRLKFTQPADRRHLESIALDQLKGRGVWVIDLLGGGQRSRAIIHKGALHATERLGDAGHVFQVLDEQGNHLPEAYIELGGRKYAPRDGRIILPYAEQNVTRNLLLVYEEFASPLTIQHQSESYQLSARFLLDRQSLIAGTQASLAIRPQLTCNQTPVSLQLLDNVQLTLTATDVDGLQTSQTIDEIQLADDAEWIHDFLVPPQLRRVSFRLTGKVYNQNRDQLQTVTVEESLACNEIATSAQIGDFYLQRTAGRFHVLVLGRNGEPIAGTSLNLAVKHLDFRNPIQFWLATNAQGVAELGELRDVDTITLWAEGVRTTEWSLRDWHRIWPRTMVCTSSESIELPLGEDTLAKSQLSLFELRQGRPQSARHDKLQIVDGALRISELEPGLYLLQDHAGHQATQLYVSSGRRQGDFIVDENRITHAAHPVKLIIRNAGVEDDQLVIRLDGTDEATRVHVLAAPFFFEQPPAEQLHLPSPPRISRSIATSRNRYVDSLRLDEEYSYILRRQGLKKFVGNMLPQPTLLIHPWELSVTDNLRDDAKAGDALPPSAQADAMDSFRKAEGERRSVETTTAWKSFDFLAPGTILTANRRVTDGVVRIPLEELKQASSIAILAVHPAAMDSRLIDLPLEPQHPPLATRDLRLQQAFDADLPLAQTQRVEILQSETPTNFGDPRTRRLQIYDSLSDVFQLYSTLLGNPEWEKFRFITSWNRLNEVEKLSRYREMACHELDFFLFHKDPKFFQKVVRPVIRQKLDMQLLDQWLLEQPLEAYAELWRVQRLNTLERILLARAIPNKADGIARWIDEYIAAHPIPPQLRQQRFEAALRGSSLSTEAPEALLELGDQLAAAPPEISKARAGFGGMPGGGRGKSPSAADAAVEKAGQRPALESESLFFGVDRLSRGANVDPSRLFQTLDKTREWAESQYYHVPLSQQNPELIGSNAFWQQYLADKRPQFLPSQLELPANNISEALCALAVIDLPFDADAPVIKIDEGQLVITSKQPAVVYLESIETAEHGDSASILVGQDIYLGQSGSDPNTQRPLAADTLLSGIAYRTSVVVTNTSSSMERLEVLTQLPAGSIPLSGSKPTRSTTIELPPYSTQQIQYSYYFPEAGTFEQYGACVSRDGRFVSRADSVQLQVKKEPASLDDKTWESIAEWGTDPQVLDFLRTNNLQQLDLSRIAFRMSDESFYQQALKILAEACLYEPVLWAYSVRHADVSQMEQLLQNHADFKNKLGSAFVSPLIELIPQEQLSYEHLDYKPLVVARIHQLGPEKTILNPSLHRQYQRLLDILAHQPQISDSQKMQLCYYLILQNRTEEAIAWFNRIDRGKLDSQVQYDYLAAYLNFYLAEYETALATANSYRDYVDPTWNQLFGQVASQVAEMRDLQNGSQDIAANSLVRSLNSEQRLLGEARTAQQTALASRSPSLSIESEGNQLTVHHANLEELVIRYYLLDIELLFSRQPFVAQSQSSTPIIQPNFQQSLQTAAAPGQKTLALPEQLANRNVLIEVSAEGIVRSAVITASSLRVDIVEPYGQLQVLKEQGRGPAQGVYVKVFARHQDGAIRFYKDGYTDLRGRFDYASLSTPELDTAQRLAILVLDPELGAVVREAAPPAR